MTPAEMLKNALTDKILMIQNGDFLKALDNAINKMKAALGTVIGKMNNI